MALPRVLLVSTNLFFVPRIHSAASASGLTLRMTTSESDFWNAYDEGGASFVLVDLEGERDFWTSIVRGLREDKKDPVRMIAFGPHADVALLEEAKAIGCDSVLSKAEFNKTLPKLLSGPVS
ncbi:MAG: hypothetical protein O2854_03245 [Chloroflexi bacterium]|nr:hypothetical protein [Chloroflexota bacterium]